MDIFRRQRDILCTKKYLWFIFNSNVAGYPAFLLSTATLNTSFLVVESLEPIYNIECTVKAQFKKHYFLFPSLE